MAILQNVYLAPAVSIFGIGIIFTCTRYLVTVTANPGDQTVYTPKTWS